jgi:Na+/H+ antiporter NhaD/arsenite permease-like protein
MVNIIIYTLVGISTTLIAGLVSISFNPFTVKLEKPVFFIGLILFAIGILFMFYSKYNEGRLQGRQDVIKILEEQKVADKGEGRQDES